MMKHEVKFVPFVNHEVTHHGLVLLASKVSIRTFSSSLLLSFKSFVKATIISLHLWAGLFLTHLSICLTNQLSNLLYRVSQLALLSKPQAHSIMILL